MGAYYAMYSSMMRALLAVFPHQKYHHDEGLGRGYDRIQRGGLFVSSIPPTGIIVLIYIALIVMVVERSGAAKISQAPSSGSEGEASWFLR